MSVISNALSFFHLSSKAEAEIPTNRQRFYSENPFEQLSVKIISHLQFHSSSYVILFFPSGQDEIIRRILEVMRSYQDRIHVVICGEKIDISSGLAQRSAYSADANDMIMQIQKRTLPLRSESDPAPTELYDSIYIGCHGSNNFLAGRRTNAISHTHHVMPSVHSLRIYEQLSLDNISP